jgi:hypothetical protein
VLHCAAVLDRFGAVPTHPNELPFAGIKLLTLSRRALLASSEQGSRESRKLIAMIKVAVPSAVAAAVDRAIQVLNTELLLIANRRGILCDESAQGLDSMGEYVRS